MGCGHSTAQRLIAPQGTFANHLTEQRICSGVGDWVTVRKLGEGACGSVMLVRHRVSGNHAAMKVAVVGENAEQDPNALNSAKSLCDEVAIMQRLHHPNICRIMETFVDPRGQSLHMVIQLCAGGEVSDWLHRWRGGGSGGGELGQLEGGVHGQEAGEDAVAYILSQLLRAVAFMHSRGVCHRDLKLANLLLSHGGPDADLVVADFGISYLSPNVARFGACGHAQMRKQCGTLGYMAPELFTRSGRADGQGYSELCDVWSVGVLAFLLLRGEHPFEAPPPPPGAPPPPPGSAAAATRERIVCGVGRPELMASLAQAGVSAGARELVYDLLNRAVPGRPSAARAAQDPWLAAGAARWASRASRLKDAAAAAAAAAAPAPAAAAEAAETAETAATAAGVGAAVAALPNGGATSVDPAAAADGGGAPPAPPAAGRGGGHKSPPSAAAAAAAASAAAGVTRDAVLQSLLAFRSSERLKRAALMAVAFAALNEATSAPAELVAGSFRQRLHSARAGSSRRAQRHRIVAHAGGRLELAAKLDALKAQFTALDTDCTGAITRHELDDALAQFSLPTPHPHTASGGGAAAAVHGAGQAPASYAIVASADQDGAGSIDYIEFLAATIEAQGVLTEARLLDAFAKFDADGSGTISAQNLREILGREWTTRDEARELVSRADTHGTGVLDIREFIDFALGGSAPTAVAAETPQVPQEVQDEARA